MRLLVFAIALLGAQKAHEKRPEIPAALRSFVDAGRAAPPELFADAIVRLEEAGKIPGRDLQRELLEEAFRAAGMAKTPVRVIAVAATPPDSRAIYRSLAGSLQLDALSLQVRVVRAMLNVDHVKAMELYTAIPKPAIDPVSCDDPLLPDDSAYFEIAGALAQSAFTPQEKAKDAPAQFLVNILMTARTPFEITGFLQGIESTPLTNDQWELMAAALASRLESMKPDYRDFAMTIDSATVPSLRKAIEHFATRLESRSITTEPLARGFRAYLVAQLSAPRCIDSPEAGQDSVNWFNASFRGQLPPIAEQEIAPGSKSGSLKADVYFQSDDTSRALSERLKSLRVNASGAPLSVADRNSMEWRSQFSDFVRDWAAWHPQVGSDVDAFHEKATLLRGAFQLSPPADDKSRLIARTVEFLRTSGAEREAPAEWIWEIKQIVTDSSDSPTFLSAFRESGDSGLVLYAMVPR